MAVIVARVQDYQSFWKEIVEPDYRDFMAKIDDLRRAFHCAISLFHMSDWVYVAHKPYIDANFTFKDRNGNTQRVHDEKSFANTLGHLCPDFDLIRGIANSAKHLVLSRPQPGGPSHAANTRVQATGWGDGGFGMGPMGGAPRVMLEGPAGHDREFSDLATTTLNMCKDLAAKHGWPL